MSTLEKTVNVEGARKPKGGRPKKADGELRDAALYVQVTPLEKSQIEQNAAKAGLSTADFVRRTCLDPDIFLENPADTQAHNQLLSELNRIGVNVNQLARAVHRGSDFTGFWKEIGHSLTHVLEKVARL